MPLSDQDYVEIFQYARNAAQNAGLRNIDERIISQIESSGNPFADLSFYLEKFIEEASIKSEIQISSIVNRFRENVKTESGSQIQGVQVILSEDDQRRYQTQDIQFVPSQEMERVASELGELLREISEDHINGLDNGPTL